VDGVLESSHSFHCSLWTFLNRTLLYNEGGETLERVAQRGSGGPIPGNIQDQVGQGSEQP